MTKRKGSAVLGIFSMPQALASAALMELPPATRDAVTPNQAGEIMGICVEAARRIGNVIDPPPAVTHIGSDAKIASNSPSDVARGLR